MSADDSQETAFLGPLLRLEAAGVDFAYRHFCVGEPRDGSTLVSGGWVHHVCGWLVEWVGEWWLGVVNRSSCNSHRAPAAGCASPAVSANQHNGPVRSPPLSTWTRVCSVAIPQRHNSG